VNDESMKEQIEAFLEHLRLNENASLHTVRAYESDLAQFVAFVAEASGRRRAEQSSWRKRSLGQPTFI
jgi:site-specific recombinase XerD